VDQDTRTTIANYGPGTGRVARAGARYRRNVRNVRLVSQIHSPVKAARRLNKLNSEKRANHRWSNEEFGFIG
jgi:hypothetical protein